MSSIRSRILAISRAKLAKVGLGMVEVLLIGFFSLFHSIDANLVDFQCEEDAERAHSQTVFGVSERKFFDIA